MDTLTELQIAAGRHMEAIANLRRKARTADDPQMREALRQAAYEHTAAAEVVARGILRQILRQLYEDAS
jgi:hypothetical protein